MTQALTAKQRCFCEEYILDLNAVAAYRRAGYKANDDAARANASRLLTKANVQSYIQQLQNDRSVRTLITADRVLQEIARVAFANIKQVASFNRNEGVLFKDSAELTDDETAAIAEVSSKKVVRVTDDGGEIETVDLKMKMHNKIAALDLAARHLGLLEKTEASIESSDGIEFKIILPKDVPGSQS